MYGDIVIKKIASDLRQTFRTENIIGRVGGDEFVVFLRNMSLPVLRRKAAEICSNYHGVLSAGGESFETSASVGVSVRQNGESFESMYRRADEALYRIKRSGKNNYSVNE